MVYFCIFPNCHWRNTRFTKLRKETFNARHTISIRSKPNSVILESLAESFPRETAPSWRLHVTSWGRCYCVNIFSYGRSDRNITGRPYSTGVIVRIRISIIRFRTSWNTIANCQFYVFCITQNIVMWWRKMFHQVNRGKGPFPNDLCKEIVFSIYFITNIFEILLLVIINRNEYHPILRQQVFRHFQPWVNHIQPIRMETSGWFRVLNQSVTILISLAAVLLIIVRILREVVIVNKVVARVVRWVYINHLHLAQIGFPKHFQHVQVIALNI